VLHETGIHGGPPIRLVAFFAAAAAVFGTTVLVGEAVGGGDDDASHMAASGESHEKKMPASEHGGGEKEPDAVRGLTVAENGLKLKLDRTELPRGRQTKLSFTLVGSDGNAVRDLEVEHTKRMHVILVRRDMSGFQHLHPKLTGDGKWSTDVEVKDAGSYRVFADFKRRGENNTLAADLAVDGPLDSRPMAPVGDTADAGDGYQVELTGGSSRAGKEAKFGFHVTRNGGEVAVQDYLGAKGHLVALREGDLAYLHVHPVEADHEARGEAQPNEEDEHAGAEDEHSDSAPESSGGEAIKFATEFPSDGRYGLYLQFKHQGKVRTASFTREVAR